MSESTIFTDDQSVEPVVENPVPITPAIPPEVVEFVGEGKKYKSMEDALKSIPHAQTHIQKLEEELAAQRMELEKSKAMEELLKEFKQQNAGTPSTEPQIQQQPNESVDIDQVVEKALARKEAERAAQANANAVISAFRDAFGDEGKAKYEKLAEETGLPLASLNNLAKTAPEAVLKLAGLTKKVGGSVPHSTSTVNSSAVPNGGEASAKVKMVGASSKDVVQAWRNAGVKAANKFNK